jgi:hypothetical protein
MEFNMTTPSLLFPAISLLFLAYTNRFLAVASLIRRLHDQRGSVNDDSILAQIRNLRERVYLIRGMQALAIFALLLCVICMFVLFFGYGTVGRYLFDASMVAMMISLGLSLRETWISVHALDVLLKDLEK